MLRQEGRRENMNYTYIVRCRDGTLYTGLTNNLEKRMEAHNSGKGARYTKSRRPVKLVYYEEFETKEEAMSREYAIKHMKKSKKEKLLENLYPAVQKSISLQSDRYPTVQKRTSPRSGMRFLP